MSRFFWAQLGVAFAAFALVIVLKPPRARAAMLLVFGFAISIAVAEGVTAAYLRKIAPNAGVAPVQYKPASHMGDDPVLGYAAKPRTRNSATRKRFDSTLFDVTYTISGEGVRVTAGNPKGDTWLFMGCSFTFGEGVNDDETLPARFSEQLGKRANVVNLGLNGYGPHHMLRMLETGRLGGAVAPVTHVIYQALPSHVARAAGRATWGFTSPSYRIVNDTVRFEGPAHGSDWIRAMGLAQRTDLGRFMLRRHYDRPPDDDEIELYVRIVERAAELSRKKFGAGFTVLFWDDDNNPTTRRILDRLSTTGLPVLRTTSFMTPRELDSLRIPWDRHPRPELYRKLAAGLATHFGETQHRINPDNRLYLKGEQSRIQPSGTIPASR